MSEKENVAERKPEHLKGSRDIGAETVRVTGDVNIPDNENVQFSLIVFGDLTAGKNVNFLKGLHIEGNLRLGEANSVKGSIHCEGNMMIGRQTTVEEAVYCLGILLVGKGVRVGFGEKGGGVVCNSTVYVEQEFSVGEKLEAEKIVTVEKLDEALISKIDQERPKSKGRSKEVPTIQVATIHNVYDGGKQVTGRHIQWQKTEHKGNVLSSASSNQSQLLEPNVRIISATDRMIHLLTDRLINLSLNSKRRDLRDRDKCPRCGSSIQVNFQFCDTCGLRLESE